MKQKVNLKVAETSPTIKRSPDTGMSAEVGVPHVVLRDITNSSNIVRDDKTLWYKNVDRIIQLKPCQVNVVVILKDHTYDPTDCKVSKCGTKNCKTCNILITDNSFSSNFTKHSFSTQSFENLSCRSYNLVYTIECTRCGLIYVGVTKDQ